MVRSLGLALTLGALLVAAYRSRVDLRSQAQGTVDLSISSSSPVRFPLPEDRAAAPHDVIEVSLPTLVPPPTYRLIDERSPSPVVLADRSPGHTLRGPPRLLS